MGEYKREIRLEGGVPSRETLAEIFKRSRLQDQFVHLFGHCENVVRIEIPT
jgi:hypothetical protein